MIIIGLVLLIVAAVFGLDLIWKNHYTIRSPALFGQTLGIHNAAELFIIGAIAGAILLLGIAMMPACAARAPRPSGTAPSARKPGTPAATATRPRRKTKNSAVARPRRRRSFLRRHRRRLEVAAPRYERHLDHKESL